MYKKVFLFTLCLWSVVGKGIPPELLEQYGNLNIPMSFITYDTSTKYPILLPFTQVRVDMPAPYQEKNSEIYYRNNQKVIQQNYSTTLPDFAINFVLFYRPLQSVDIKNVKVFFSEEKDRMILQYGNYPVIEQLSANNAYYEYYSQNGKIHRIKLEIVSNTLVGLIVSGNTPAIYAAPANDFFASLDIPTNTTTNNESLLQPKYKSNVITKEADVIKINSPSTNNSYTLNDSLFTVTLITKPTKQDFLIKNEIDSYHVVSYYTDKKNKGDQYLISYRIYSKNIEAEDVFFANASKIFAQSSKTEISTSRMLDFYKYPSKEYVFKSKKSKYIVRYFAKGNTFIQLVIKCKLKGDNTQENIRFFDSFTL